jgi:hypothetical protein
MIEELARARHPPAALSTWLAALCAASLPIVAASPARAMCNVIPAATKEFRAALGSANRPFAGPGEWVELRVRPPICDGTSTGFVDLDGDGGASDDYVATVLFVPPPLATGPANAVVLAESCAGLDVAACDATLGTGTAECVEVNGRLGRPRGRRPGTRGWSGE